MSDIRAAQLIYGNFAAAESPRRKGGFQTAFYSRSFLDDQDIEDIEARLLYYASSAPIVKRVFFTIRRDRRVICQIVPLASTDSSGRAGLYVGHALILNAGDLARVRPWKVLESYPFVDSIEAALERGDRETGELPETTIPANQLEKAPGAISSWDKDALRSLMLWALRASTLARDGMTLAFVGSEREVNESIQAAMLAVPSNLLPHCSFDTWFYRCNPAQTYYWAAGLPEAPTGSRYLIIDAASRTIRAPAPTGTQTSFEEWGVQLVCKGNLDLVIEHRDSAFNLFEWLDGRATKPELERLPDVLVRSACETGAKAIRARVQQRVATQFPSSLSGRAAEHILRTMASHEMLRLIDQGLTVQEVATLGCLLFEADGFRKPEREALRWASEIAQRGGASELELLCLCWNLDHAGLRQRLSFMTVGDYVEFLRLAFRHQLVPPLELLIRGRAQPYTETLLAGGSAAVDIVQLVARMIDLEDPASLPLLIPMLGQAKGQQLREIDRLISRLPQIPPAFRERLVEELRQQPEPTSFLGGLFRRGSRRS